LLQSHNGRARPLAGGTDLVVQMKEKATKFPAPALLVSLSRIRELKGIEFSETLGVRIGAGATMAEVAESAIIRERFAAIAEGAGVVGSVQTMNMATVGGNICNAAPSADIVPPLLAYEAAAVIIGPAGRRSVPLTEFFVSPGRTVLAADELLAEVTVPSPSARTGSAYVRHTPRKQMDIAAVGVGVAVTISDDNRIDKARVALGAVAPTPIRSRQAEAILEGAVVADELIVRAAGAATDEAQPISDTRGSADFRRHLLHVMTERMLRLGLERAGQNG